MEHDAAPALRHFGPHASRIARLIRLQPKIAPSLLCAPIRAVHAVGIHLYRVGSAPDFEVAHELAKTNPRHLIWMAFPAAPPQLYRLLDRAGDTVRPWEFYALLAESAAGPFSKVLFADHRPIDNAFVRHLSALANADRAIRRLPPKVLADEATTDAITAVHGMLHALGGTCDAVFADLPENVGVEGILKRLVERISCLGAPRTPSQIPVGMKQIMTVGDLRDAGERLNLCVATPACGGAEHWMRLVGGRSIYLTHDEPVGLIELRFIAPDLWTFGDMRRMANRPFAPATRRAVAAALGAAGWRLVPVDPGEGLCTLTLRSDAPFQLWDRALGDALRGLESEALY